MVTQQAALDESKGFQEEAIWAISALRGALAGVIEDLPQAGARSLDLAQQMGLDKSLASKISRLISENPDPFDLAAYLPGKAAFGAFLRAAHKKGVSETKRAAVTVALDQLDVLADRHAGDKGSLTLMLSACAADSETPASIAQRRTAYRANSVMFGVQARAQYKLAAIGPSEVPGQADIARIRGFVAMRRLRPDVAWTLVRGQVVSDLGRPVASGYRPRPLSLGGDESGQLLLSAFSYGELPRIEVVTTSDGMVEERILAGPVGNGGAFTLFSGDSLQAVGPIFRDAENEYAASVARLHTPVEVLVYDYFVHAFIFDSQTPEFALYNELGGPAWPACGEPKKLPISAQAQRLGQGLDHAHAVEIPKLKEIAAAMFASMGWDPREFLHFRARLPFPPIPCSAVMRTVLPDQAAQNTG